FLNCSSARPFVTFFLTLPRPSRSTLFPYTTLFRSISIDALLSYSAVCGTGLDTVPLPGDITAEQLSLIIGDMASLAFKWHKPLRSEEHTSELQSRFDLVCRLLLEKKNISRLSGTVA